MHELVLAGIGGKTVEECAARMSLQELSRWRVFREKWGPLNPLMRLDAAIARAAAPFLSGTDSAKAAYLLPWPVEPEVEATPEDVMKLLMAARVPEKR